MAGGGKAEIRTNGGQRLIRIAEEAFCFLRFFFQDEVRQTFARLFLEFPGEIGAVQEQFLRHFLNCDRLRQVAQNVVCHIHGELRGVLAQMQPLYPFRVVQDHPILQVHDLRR